MLTSSSIVQRCFVGEYSYILLLCKKLLGDDEFAVFYVVGKGCYKLPT